MDPALPATAVEMSTLRYFCLEQDTATFHRNADGCCLPHSYCPPAKGKRWRQSHRSHQQAVEWPFKGSLHRYGQLRHPVSIGPGCKDESRAHGGLLPHCESRFIELLCSVSSRPSLNVFLFQQDFMFFEKVGEANQRSTVFS